MKKLFFLLILYCHNVIAANEPVEIFVKIDPRGTYLFVDTVNGHVDQNGNPNPDIQIAPSELSLIPLYLDPMIQLQEGDLIKLEVVGNVSFSTNLPDDANGLFAVFKGQNGFLYPGEKTSAYPAISLPTCTASIPTDIPYDFVVDPRPDVYAQIPRGATKIQFSFSDCFFKDNADPNFDFGVWVKITIKPIKFVARIDNLNNPSSVELPPSFYNYPGKKCAFKNENESTKRVRLSCSDFNNDPSNKCKVSFKLSLGEHNGGHYKEENRPYGKIIDGQKNRLLENVYYLIPETGLIIDYIAPDVSGDVKLSYDVRDSEENEVTSLASNFSVRSAERFEKISIDGLVFKINSRPGDGDYGTPEFILKLKEMINFFHEYKEVLEVPANKVVVLESQAGSLSWGGLFDIDNNWKPSHCGHRNGKALDISMSKFIINTNNEEDLITLSLEWAVEDAMLNTPMNNEKPDDFENHWHIQD